MESAVSDEVFRQSGTAGGLPESLRGRLHAAFDQIRALQPQIGAVEQGEQAAAILADFDNLQSARKRAVPKDDATRRRFRETMERMRQDIAADASQMGLDGNSGDLENQLQARVRAEQDVISAAKPIDFAAVSGQWAQQIRHDPQQRMGLDARLSAAAQAKALRPDADLSRARDLDLASRAAASLAASSRAGRIPPQKAFDNFVASLSSLLEIQRTDPKHQPALSERQIAALQDLRRLAVDPTANATRSAMVAAEDRQKEVESLAVRPAMPGRATNMAMQRNSTRRWFAG